MGIQSSNTDKELKKNNFETANHADTIQLKSIDGLQNHADTQKLTQFKTASEQSNRHEKLTQFKTAAERSNRHEKLTQLQSMGDARAHEIQNGGVVQFGGKTDLLKSASKAAMEVGGGAARIGARGVGGAAVRGAGKVVGFGAAGVTGLGILNTGTDIADKLSEIAAQSVVGNGSSIKILESLIGLAEIRVSKSALPDELKNATTNLLKTLGKLAPIIAQKAESSEDDVSNLFIDDKDRVIAEAIRQYSSIVDNFGFPNPLAFLISIDNMQSRYKALMKIMEDKEELFIGQKRRGMEKHLKMKEMVADRKFKIEHPDVAAYLEENKNATDDELLHTFPHMHVEDIDF